VSRGPLERVRGAAGRLAGPGSTARDTLRQVRGASTRVALISTAIVAVVYLVISAVVAIIVTSQLTGDVTSQVASTLRTATADVNNIVPGPRPQALFPDLEAANGLAQEVWCIDTSGQAHQWVDAHQFAGTSSAISLPASDAGVTTAQSVPLHGTSYLVAGDGVLNGPTITAQTLDPALGKVILTQFQLARIVVGQSMASVGSALSTVILAESIVGPILLLAVFLGALAVGRRVAAPIELARLRQLEFTADASHELRTPLSVIEAQTSLALAEPRDPAWYRGAFQRVQGESGRIRRLVEDLLWLARFDSTRDRAQAEYVDVGILTQIAADRFTAVAEAKGLRLSVRTAPGPLVVNAPPEWLDRLLGVLLDNACKYVPPAGTIDVSVWADGNRIRLSVDDSGPGIPAEERERIFDRFRRATDQPGGAGLGLAIANSVVTATAGRWLIWESPAGGASMGVSWPRSLSGSPGPADAATEPAPSFVSTPAPPLSIASPVQVAPPLSVASPLPSPLPSAATEPTSPPPDR
jgi:signal transduction histidine kinase